MSWIYERIVTLAGLVPTSRLVEDSCSCANFKKVDSDIIVVVTRSSLSTSRSHFESFECGFGFWFQWFLEPSICS
jgi:hypothetical protein